MTGEVPGWKKWGALVVFAVQNAGAVLLMRYSKLQNGPAYSNLAAVMMQELIKLGVSTVRPPSPTSAPRPRRPRASESQLCAAPKPSPSPPRALRSCSTPTSVAAWGPWSQPCVWTCVTTRWSGCS
jgi:hypothetical protein